MISALYCMSCTAPVSPYLRLPPGTVLNLSCTASVAPHSPHDFTACTDHVCCMPCVCAYDLPFVPCVHALYSRNALPCLASNHMKLPLSRGHLCSNGYPQSLCPMPENFALSLISCPQGAHLEAAVPVTKAAAPVKAAAPAKASKK